MDKDRLIALAVKNPDLFFSQLKQHSLREDMPQVMLELAEKIPGVMLENFSKYEHKLYAADVRDKSVATLETLKDGYYALVNYADVYLSTPKGPEVLERAANTAFAKQDYDLLLARAGKLQALPFGEALTAKTIQAARFTDLHEHSDGIANRPDFKATYEAALKTAPAGVVMDHYYSLRERPDAETLLETAVKSHPHPAAYSHFFADKPYAREAIIKTIDHTIVEYPESIIRHGPELLKLFPEASNTAREVSEPAKNGAAKAPAMLSQGELYIQRAAIQLGTERLAGVASRLNRGPVDTYGATYMRMLKQLGNSERIDEAYYGRLAQEFETGATNLIPKLQELGLGIRVGDGDNATITLAEIKKTLKENEVDLDMLDIDKDGRISEKEILETITDLKPLNTPGTAPAKPKGNER